MLVRNRVIMHHRLDEHGPLVVVLIMMGRLLIVWEIVSKLGWRRSRYSAMTGWGRSVMHSIWESGVSVVVGLNVPVMPLTSWARSGSVAPHVLGGTSRTIIIVGVIVPVCAETALQVNED